MAYRTRDSVARIMAWSDEWNTAQRRIMRRNAGAGYLSYFRLLGASFLETWVSVTNAGSHELDQPAECTVIVENHPGGSTLIGADYVARSAPDGRTLLYGATSMATTPTRM